MARLVVRVKKLVVDTAPDGCWLTQRIAVHNVAFATLNFSIHYIFK